MHKTIGYGRILGMNITHLTNKDFTVSSWSGGSTTQLFIYPPEAEYAKRNFRLRISSATVDTERSDFTVLPNIRRFIAPLTGVLKISHDESAFTELQPYQVYEFDGGAKTVSLGKVRDFNVMIQNAGHAETHAASCTAEQPLQFRVAKNEIGWFFSFQNAGTVTVRCGAENSCDTCAPATFDLTPMTLFVFEPAESAAAPIEIACAFDSDVTVLYGSVELSQAQGAYGNAD